MAKKKDTPEYRVYAFANFDLKEHMAKTPYVLDDPGKVKWEVQRDGDKYVAMGTIKVPVTMFFSEDPEKENDLIVDRVVIKGERLYDSRGIDESALYDPSHGVDEIRMMANARHMVR